jgi:hypothetical protein
LKSINGVEELLVRQLFDESVCDRAIVVSKNPDKQSIIPKQTNSLVIDLDIILLSKYDFYKQLIEINFSLDERLKRSASLKRKFSLIAPNF